MIKIIRFVGFVLIIVVALFVLLPLLIPLPSVGVDPARFAEPGSFFVRINSLETYAVQRGPLDGPPVVLLHGWGASTFSWRENIDALAEAGYRVVAYDRPPYGLSTKTGDIPYTLDGQARFLVALLDELGIEQAALVGNSAGGFLAGYVAARHPERVTGIVLVDGVPLPPDAFPRGGGGGGRFGIPSFVTALLDYPPGLWWARQAVRAFIEPDFITDILVTAYHDPAFVTPEIIAGYQRPLQVRDWDIALVGQVRGMAFGGAALTADEIAAIDVPTLVIWGAEDTWIPVDAAEQFVALQPTAQLIIYPDIGHIPMEENAAQFNADVLTFLETLS